MAHFHIKMKKGRPYLYVREIQRINGKPTVVSQIYIGSPEKVATFATGGGKSNGDSPGSDVALKVEEFGALWLANMVDQEVDLAGLVDSVIPRDGREKGPSVGEYFLYAVLNKMVESVSKNRLADWYERTAIQQVRPVEVDALTAQRYWEKWERVSEQDLERIAQRFFERIWAQVKPKADCLLFDTTNYFTFMASQTDSDLCQRGKNKEGRHHLRQIGLGLLVARDSRIPLYYRAYPGNIHDSKLFQGVLQEMFGVVGKLGRTEGQLTLVIDKGMNSEDNFAIIDEQAQVHFVTTYSGYFAEELSLAPLSRFAPLGIEKNRRLKDCGHEEDQLLAFRTTGEYWGKERAVIVTHNPATARKQGYILDEKLEKLRLKLLNMRGQVKAMAPQWRDPTVIRERYAKACEVLHLPQDLFTLEFSGTSSSLNMSFRKDAYREQKRRATFGRNIIISDHINWSTDEIVQASLDRWQVEDTFRLTKDDDLVAVQPVRHWTDPKIRCQLFTCVVASTYLRLLEWRLKNAGIDCTAVDVMDDMHHLHSVLSLKKGREISRQLERPSKTQSDILSALGYTITPSGVLQPK